MKHPKYMVSVTGGNAPSTVHEHSADAFTEARRLAAKYPNKDVYVLEIKAKMRGEIVVKEIADDNE